MARGWAEWWENTVRRALEALGGEDSEPAILRWVQDNRPNLAFGWQQQVRAALQDHADGRGHAVFESVPDRPNNWRLVQWFPPAEPELPNTPERSQLRRLGKLMVRALAESSCGDITPLEMYLLGMVAYRLAWHREAIKLLDMAVANHLGGEHRAEAERLRAICAMKTEG